MNECLIRLLTNQQVQTNSFDRTDVDTGQAGIFLHPTLAMANHSCIPNAVVSFSGRQAFLRAELPIKKGDEVTISYIGKYHFCGPVRAGKHVDD